ncbi:PEP-CTERM sorting domain-containing protein [Mitsuaria sp. GD03876]|uniref:PEP-CTERM sorting domain-containing protein n=1 Tax=Mitsuaria sp. GD03876 TaxID=2975399 RepID=UPI0024483CE8|nr:PEP-CTERM sorting domain-containing protein [Mitsuaria sp. GD03876]MDH0865974.1 PEP-CTERM sorting domain-containing protein [Mitsuaria sp. GD03876]
MPSTMMKFSWRLAGAVALAAAALAPSGARAEATKILFVGNSYTFGRIDPVMSYNAANVHDLTASMYATNPSGANGFEPHPWGGVAGIFKQFTVQVGLDYDVSISARNAASLRGQFLNTNNAGWDLRGNIGSQAWDKVVLQEQSDEPLTKQAGLSSNPAYFNTYTNLIENWVHQGNALSYRERDLIGGTNAKCAEITGASTGTCSLLRNVAANANANAAADVYLYQTWARPNLVNAPSTTVTDENTGEIIPTGQPAPSFYPTLQAMTDDLKQAYAAAALLAGADGSGGIKGIAPVGEAFMRAIAAGFATPDMYAANAATDGLLDLWFDDGTHASKYGSYLSALTLFGTITGLDPSVLGFNEIAARDLGISARDALLLQRVASEQLGFAAAVPEPGSFALAGLGVAMLWMWRRRRHERTATAGAVPAMPA